VLVDGPFVETREVVGGLYVVEAPDLDAALALAQRVPEVRESHSGVEVRPIVSG
ncbi:YciI family protein, partial [Streptococcus pyogenes]|uniref:YciI family protein n=1 Tax=Streptococcus pyogenes TaxID=1314 RepID=UPI003DA06AD2